MNVNMHVAGHSAKMKRLLVLIACMAGLVTANEGGRQACQQSDVALQSYHIHVLFPPSNALATNAAMDLQRQFMTAFDLTSAGNCTMSAGDPAPNATMCAFEVDWEPAGPFLTAQYSFFVPVTQYEAAVSWIVRHRGKLDVLVHPNSGCEVEDHTAWALWAGRPWELDTSVFSCESPGCTPP